MAMIEEASTRLKDVKPGRMFRLRKTPGIVYVHASGEWAEGLVSGPHVVAFVVADSDQFDTQDTYVPMGRMFVFREMNEPVDLIAWAKNPTFRVSAKA